MGVFLVAGMLAGCALGVIVTAALVGAGIIAAMKSAKSRMHVWWTFAAVFAIALTLCIIAVHEYPYGMASPGSDYDVVMKNFFLQGLGYCASLGLAALIAALTTFLAPRKATNRTAKPNNEIQPAK